MEGCAIVTPQVSGMNMNFSPRAMEYLGQGEGETSVTYLFCALPLEDWTTLSAVRAIKKAIKSKHGDALINGIVESRLELFPFFCVKVIKAYGAVVKFKTKKVVGQLEQLSPNNPLSR